MNSPVASTVPLSSDAIAAGAMAFIATPLSAGQSYPEGTIIGQPRDVANVIAFLASDDARHVQGCTIDVNGGLYMN